MNTLYRSLIAAALIAASATTASATGADGTDNSTRRERNYIVDGNRLYRQERYADAEVAYRKALELDAMNEIAQFNLASSLLRQGTATGDNEKNASQILTKLASDAEDATIAELSAFNLGNIAYNGQNYQQAVERYKQALRRNPDHDQARDNLRMAQKRLEEQQNQDQDQNKDQNKDQNQDQNKDQNQDQNKDPNQQQQQNQDQQQQQQQQQQQSGISKENAEKILKAMENEENATRQRINAERKKNGAPSRRQVTNPW